MDIRNFFGKKGVTKPSTKKRPAAAERSSASTPTKSTPNNNKSKSSNVTTDINSSSPSMDSSRRNITSTLKPQTKRRRINDVDDVKEDERKSRATKQPKADPDTIVDSDATTTDEDFIPHQKVNPGRVGRTKENHVTQPSVASSTKHTKKDSVKKQQPQKRRIIIDESDDDDDDEWDGSEEKHTLLETSPHSKTPEKQSTSKTTPSKRTRTANKAKDAGNSSTPMKPETSIDSYPVDSATPGCLEGFCFVFSGVLPNFSREESEDYIKTLGGRVTKAVSGKTNYLVCGEQLEDGRHFKEGSKYRKAMDLGESKITILQGKGQLFALVQLLDNKKKHQMQRDGSVDNIIHSQNSIESKSAASINPNATSSKIINNPYGKKQNNAVINNPYAKKSPIKNPYATSKNQNTVNNPYTKSPTRGMQSDKPHSIGGGRAHVSDPHALWTDKYAPNATDEILGNQESVRKLSLWLERWEQTFNNPTGKKKSIGAPGGPFKAALLSGPPGIGKTTTAILVAKKAGRTVLELNASDTRSKKSLVEGLGDVTGSHVLSFSGTAQNNKDKSKRCIIMDEVDGMGAGDRSGMAELIKMIKSSKVPIICICNDRQSQKVKSLAQYCLDLKYRRPVKTVIARRAMEIGAMEGMKVEMNAAEAIAESCGNDIRQVLNCLQMWANKKQNSGGKSDMTYRDLKERQGFINKDEILRVSMFDATRLIVEGCKGLASADPKIVKDSLYKRCDAFFTDYSLMGLNVHQNYIKVMIGQFQDTKRKNDEEEELACLERMYAATDSMSDFGVVENAVRGGDQNWALLPLCSVMAVKTGHHIAGPNGSFLPGYPEFAGWLGKNSSRGKMYRLLKELNHHMNYKVGVDSTELRLLYLPILREFLMILMTAESGPKIREVIEMMDDYGLDRDDLFENLDVFTLESKPKKFSDLDSKVKASFTREYNKLAHKSQALVGEQGMTKSKKKKSGDKVTTGGELDVVNDDGMEENDDEDDEALDEIDVSKLFKAKGRASKSKATKGKKKK